MAWEITIDTCPQCKNEEAEVVIEHNLRIYRLSCHICGYLFDSYAETEDVEGELSFCTDKAGHVIYNDKEYKGYGVRHIKSNKNESEFYLYSQPITQKDIDDFNKLLSERDDIDYDNSFLREWKDGVIKILAGNETGTYPYY